jgi:outer membrane protein assembly factor BamE
MKTMHNILKFLTLMMMVTVVGCAGERTIKPFKLEIQQGNVVTSEMLLKLRPGMTKSQVQFILGTPLLIDSFHTNRWDYFYQLRKQGEIVSQRRVILDFDGEALVRVRGDVVPEGTDIDALTKQPQLVSKPADVAVVLDETNPDLITTSIEPPVIESTGETVDSDTVESTVVMPQEEVAAIRAQTNETTTSTARTTQSDMNIEALTDVETAVGMPLEKITVPKMKEIEATVVTEMVPASIVEVSSEASSEVIIPKLIMDRIMAPVTSDMKSRYRVGADQSATSEPSTMGDVADSATEKTKQGIDRQKDSPTNKEAPGLFERILKKIGF